VCFHHILYNKGLLQNCTIEDLALYCQLGLEPAWMGLCPDETSIHKLDLHQANRQSSGQTITYRLLLHPWYGTPSHSNMRIVKALQAEAKAGQDGLK